MTDTNTISNGLMLAGYASFIAAYVVYQINDIKECKRDIMFEEWRRKAAEEKYARKTAENARWFQRAQEHQKAAISPLEQTGDTQ